MRKPHSFLCSFRSTALLLVCASLCLPVAAATTSVSFEDFNTFDPEVLVVSPTLATMTDSEFVSTVTLTNDPFAFDPEVIVPAVGRLLTFDYAFDQAPGNIDEFSVYLFDAADGPFFGLLDSTTITSSGSGGVSFDLTSYVGLSLGLQFELFDPGFLTGSSVTLSNLVLSDATALAPVPVPPALMLFISAIGMLKLVRSPDRGSIR